VEHRVYDDDDDISYMLLVSSSEMADGLSVVCHFTCITRKLVYTALSEFLCTAGSLFDVGC